jgi:hypothetical protein
MSAAEVLAQHRLVTRESSLHSNTYSCSCNDAGECAMGVTTNWRVHAGHQIDALKAAGYAVVELPSSCPQPQHWDEACLGAWEAINYGADPVSAWPNNRGGRGSVALPDGSFISADAARDLAGAILAAADAAEQVIA